MVNADDEFRAIDSPALIRKAEPYRQFLNKLTCIAGEIA
jgi:hypothetical protein